MSAESPRRAARCVPNTVPPQAVSDRSLLDSVTGFINDVTLTNLPQIDPKDAILWTRFETTADITDPTFGEDWDLEGGVAPPLLLLLGYGTGVQCWAIPANGEAVEVLSWRHGNVRALRVLPLPVADNTTDDLTDGANVAADLFASHRPLMAICDASVTGSGPQFCAVNFVSLRGGEQVKSIKFKNTILDILANRSVVVVTFSERIAVFDARTLEDRLTVTTCHPGTSLNPNPVALGSRWLAYAERKILPSKRSSGGCDCDGVASYTATVLNAAKTLGKGLRELGEQMAAGFTGGGGHNSFGLTSGSSGNGTNSPMDDVQPGVVTIMDIKYSIKDTSPTTGAPISTSGADPIIAHFIAHSDAIVALSFDCSGMLLATADKRGHDFHVFRVQPHPSGPSLSAVHHLYVLHRGDTTAKVQDIVFSLDSRWIAVSTLRGTTHVFPVTPYGGPAGVRTHGSPHVVNRLSRFHRSAGLSMEGRSNSPVHSTSDHSVYSQMSNAYNNPRVAPFPHPTVVLPLAQLRQPSTLGQSAAAVGVSQKGSLHHQQQVRQRLTSLSSDDATVKPLRVCATFAKARAWLLEPPGGARDLPSMRMQRKAVDSLFIMASHGALIQYDLEPKTNINIPKDKISDDTSIELDVEPKAQWNLVRKEGSMEIQAPLPMESWLLKDRLADANISEAGNDNRAGTSGGTVTGAEDWLSQVEIITHAGPHRRLWMGPQFIFKTYNTPSGAPLSYIDTEAVEVGINPSGSRARSNPMNMPLSSGNAGRSAVPVLIESGSCSSYEQSPRLVDQYRHEHMGSDFSIGAGDSQLREDLADAMRESPGRQSRDSGPSSNASTTSAARTVIVSIAKVVNPLGTVTTVVHPSQSGDANAADDLDEFSYCGDGDEFIHENCDEALFRPVVAVFTNATKSDDEGGDEIRTQPTVVGQELIVPVIEKRVDDKRESAKRAAAAAEATAAKQQHDTAAVAKLEELSQLNRRNKVGVADGTKEPRERKKSETKQPKISEKDVSVRKEGKKGSEKNNKKQKVEEITVEPVGVTVTEKEGRSSKITKKFEENAAQVEIEPQILKMSKKAQKKTLKSDDSPSIPPATHQLQNADACPLPSKVSLKLNDQKKEITPPQREQDQSSQLKVAKSRKSSVKTDYPQLEEDVLTKASQKSRKVSIKLEEPLPPASSPPVDELPPLLMLRFSDMMKTDFDDDQPARATRQCSAKVAVSVAAEKVSSKKSKKIAAVEPGPPANSPASTSLSTESSSGDMDDVNVDAEINISLKKTKPDELVDIVELVQVARVDSVNLTTLKQPTMLNKPLRKPRKSDKQLEVKSLVDNSLSYMDTVDSVGLNVIECFEEECSSIQDSIFIDPVVTTTFVVKKSNIAKPSFADMFNSTNDPQPIPAPRLCTTSSGSVNDTSANLISLAPRLDFEFPEQDISAFADAFAPLEPFDLNFENLTLRDDGGGSSTTDEFVSLINFQSPLQEIAQPIAINSEEPVTSNESTSTATDDKRLVFSLCSTFKNCNDADDGDNADCDDDNDDDDGGDDDDGSDEPPILLYECQDSDYKSLEQEIDETYLSLEIPAPLCTIVATKELDAANSSSTDDTEDSSSQQDTRPINANAAVKASDASDSITVSAAPASSKYKQEDDEELQPLIGLTISQEDDNKSSTDNIPENEVGGGDGGGSDDAATLPTEDANQTDFNKLHQQQPTSAVTAAATAAGNKKKNKKKRR